MAIILTKKQAGAIAKAFSAKTELSYMQGLDTLAEALGFSGNAALMAALSAEAPSAAPELAKKALPPLIMEVKAEGSGKLIASIDAGLYFGETSKKALLVDAASGFEDEHLHLDVLTAARAAGCDKAAWVEKLLDHPAGDDLEFTLEPSKIREWLLANREDISFADIVSSAKLQVKPSSGPDRGWEKVRAIGAEAHSDDHRIQVTIDARPFLMEATADQIRAMAACDWSSDYATDEIYHSAEAAGCPEADRLASYLATINGSGSPRCGFSVSIDEGDVMDWLMDVRPGLYSEVEDIFDETLDMDTP